ncbi:hypothetical protein [Cryptosporangium sp. NPDC048952]|uniref:hypothetical protein n=1 Tax=Cryptosporangium sp. NPDC048952 TaxID=3363961 RepID=UPI0037127E0C
MVTKTKFAVGVVLGAALAGTLAATPAVAAPAAQAADRHGRVEGTYRSYDDCQDAGRRGQRHHQWRRFDCDRRDDHGRGGRHHDRHDRDDWVLKVYR